MIQIHALNGCFAHSCGGLLEGGLLPAAIGIQGLANVGPRTHQAFLQLPNWNGRLATLRLAHQVVGCDRFGRYRGVLRLSHGVVSLRFVRRSLGFDLLALSWCHVSRCSVSWARRRVDLESYFGFVDAWFASVHGPLFGWTGHVGVNVYQCLFNSFLDVLL